MIRDSHVLLKFLYENPTAWPVRMALIEEMVKEGDLDRAKALIRESPDEAFMPADYPLRIHTLMTKGAEGLNTLPPLPGFEDPEPEDDFKSEPEPKKIEDPVPPAQRQSTSSSKTPDLDELASSSKKPEPPSETSKVKIEDADHQMAESPLFDYQASSGKVDDKGKLVVDKLDTPKGGAGALVESHSIRVKKGPKPLPPTIDQEIANIRWEKYSGVLNLTRGEIPDSVGKPSRTGDRMSAFFLAFLAHVAAAIAISFVVIHIPRPTPPKLVVTVPDDNNRDDLVVHKMSKPAELEPSAASVQAVNVETALELSSFSLPEVENDTMLDVTAMIDGAAEIGSGMSMSRDLHKQSDINFFGISSGGESIVFVIDATKPMLVDEKGGMFAYDKVKNEIASMLVNLNRGTKFNILLYDGKRVMAYRDDLVRGLPSNIRLAMEWLDPLNRDYENLGLPRDFGISIEVASIPGLPIQSKDTTAYLKCIQKAMEWKAAAIFCISSGYQQINRSLSPEMEQLLRDNPGTPGTPGKVAPADQKRYEREQAQWRAAQEKTREWLEKENEARRAKGLSPKVVTNFNELVTEVTGQSPPRAPRRTGGTPATPSPVADKIERPGPATFEDIDKHLKRLVIEYYRKKREDDPSVHMVLFLGEEEPFPDAEKDHFSRITRQNNGKLKILRGLAALSDVTTK